MTAPTDVTRKLVTTSNKSDREQTVQEASIKKNILETRRNVNTVTNTGNRGDTNLFSHHSHLSRTQEDTSIRHQSRIDRSHDRSPDFDRTSHDRSSWRQSRNIS